MLRKNKVDLSEKMFEALEKIALEYCKDYDVKIAWEASIKINGESFFDWKTGAIQCE